jgi:predicted nucleic acid-binding protein
MGLIHIDAGVVIGLLDADDAHHTAARAALARSQHAGDRLAMAASAFAKCLVGPAKRGGDAVEIVEDLFERLPIGIVDLDRDIARAAATLRARHKALRLPDAVVIATAARRAADQLVTTDLNWPSARALKLELAIVHL